MRDTKRTLRPASSGDSDAVKPVPPVDLRKRLDAAITALPLSPNRPAGSFTRMELQVQRGIEEGAATRLLGKLIKAGIVRKEGYRGVNVYYTFTGGNNGTPSG